MQGLVPTLATITDGEAAWSEFLSGVQQAFADNAAAVPALVIVVVVLFVLWADFRIAKWIVGRSAKKQGRRSAKQ
ncbi:MAG: hypothetical protein ACIARQ_11870 [Phycisphaerales bacterium JB061]